jgi:hypothetical protein
MSYFSIYNSYSKSKLPFSKIYDNKYKQMNPKIKTIITSNLSYKQIYNCSNNPSLNDNSRSSNNILCSKYIDNELRDNLLNKKSPINLNMKLEFNHNFLSTQSTKSQLTFRKNTLFHYYRIQFQKPRIRTTMNKVNPYSNCDPLYLKRKNSIINNLSKVKIKFNKLKISQPLNLSHRKNNSVI